MLTGTAVYGTVRTVVWEDGGGDPASYPIAKGNKMKFFSILFLLMIAGNIHAAGIDCGKTKSAIEKTICGDDELLKLDETLDEAYRQALRLTGGIRKSQRQWLKYERNVCKSVDCIKSAYETRIQELGLSHYGIAIFRNTPLSEVTSKPSKLEVTGPNDTPIQTQIKAQKSAGHSPNNTPIVKYSAPLVLSGKVSILAGKAGLTGAKDGFGANARFRNPFGITTDGTNLYVSETANQTIRKIEITTGKVTTLAGKPGKRGAADGIGRAARFNFPYGIATDGNNLYVADSGNSTIRKIVIATRKVTTLAGAPGKSGYSDRVGMAAQFTSPQDITIVGNNLYVTDRLVDTIRKIDVSTGEVTTFAGKARTWGFTDGIGSAARFGLPEGITTDGSNLYVAESYNNTIRKLVISTGKVTTLAGPDNATCVRGRNGCPGGSGTNKDDGFGTTARFNYPGYITNDGTNLYVTDSDRVIRKIVIATGKVTTLSTASNESSFVTIRGITNDGTSLYVTDVARHIIIRIQ
jgi:uncharacterized protein